VILLDRDACFIPPNDPIRQLAFDHRGRSDFDHRRPVVMRDRSRLPTRRRHASR
jgi:hypothetical protein